MRTHDTLRSKLEAVAGSYSHFVEKTVAYAEHFNISKEIEDYIDAHEDVTASDVIKMRIFLVYGDVV